MADGSAYMLRMPIPREEAMAMLTANGGEEIDPLWLKQFAEPQLDYGKVWGFGLFVVVALLPGVPAIRRRIWPNILASQVVTQGDVSESSTAAV